MADLYEVSVEHAPKMMDWIQTRGGVAVWESLDLSDPGFRVSTPVQTEGQPTGKPHWKVGSTPARVITDPAEIAVVTRKEVRRFRVAVRMGANGLRLKVTDAGSARIRRAVAAAGPDATYTFDYGTQEAVILVPDGRSPTLLEWVREAVR